MPLQVGASITPCRVLQYVRDHPCFFPISSIAFKSPRTSLPALVPCSANARPGCTSGVAYSTGQATYCLVRVFSGADRDRTDDLLNAIQALSQLSYSPTRKKKQRTRKVVGWCHFPTGQSTPQLPVSAAALTPRQMVHRQLQSNR